METFGVAGGDQRQLYLARALEKKGCRVFLNGLETLEGAGDFTCLPLEELAQRCPVVLLPLPATRDGTTLQAPFSREPIPLGDGFARMLCHCHVLGGWWESCGKLPLCGRASPWRTTTSGKS